MLCSLLLFTVPFHIVPVKASDNRYMSLYSDQDQNFDELQSCPVVHSIISRQTWPINGLLKAQEYSIFINLCAEIFLITYQALCSKTFVGSERKRFPNWGREQSSSAIWGESRTDQSARGLRTNTPTQIAHVRDEYSTSEQVRLGSV